MADDTPTDSDFELVFITHPDVDKVGPGPDGSWGPFVRAAIPALPGWSEYQPKAAPLAATAEPKPDESKPASAKETTRK